MFTLDEEETASLDTIQRGDVLIERSTNRMWTIYDYAYSISQNGNYEIYIQINKTPQRASVVDPSAVWLNIGDGSGYLRL